MLSLRAPRPSGWLRSAVVSAVSRSGRHRDGHGSDPHDEDGDGPRAGAGAMRTIGDAPRWTQGSSDAHRRPQVRIREIGTPVPYSKAKGKRFLTSVPSARAAELIRCASR